MCALLLAAALVTTLFGLTGSAKDLELLTRYLVPVYLSQDFAEACRAANPDYLRALPHGSATVDELSEQTKREITDKLTDDEAAMVVLVAANTALQAVKNEMRKISTLSHRNPAGKHLLLNRWCEDEAQPYILEVMRKNQREHDVFLKIIEKAKH